MTLSYEYSGQDKPVPVFSQDKAQFCPLAPHLAKRVLQAGGDILGQGDGAAEPQVIEGDKKAIEEAGEGREVQQHHGWLQRPWLGRRHWHPCTAPQDGRGRDERVGIHLLPKLLHRLLHRLLESGGSHALEEGGQLPTEVSPHPAEREAEVHALPQQRVQAAAHPALEIALQRPQELRDLLQHPAMEDGPLVEGLPLGGQEWLLVGEDGTILGNDVEEVDAAGLDGLGDVEIGVVVRDGGLDGMQPGIPRLQELDAQLSLREDIHAPQVADDPQAGWQLDVGAELLDELVQHQLGGLAHLVHDALGQERGLSYRGQAQGNGGAMAERGLPGSQGCCYASSPAGARRQRAPVPPHSSRCGRRCP